MLSPEYTKKVMQSTRGTQRHSPPQSERRNCQHSLLSQNVYEVNSFQRFGSAFQFSKETAHTIYPLVPWC